MPDFNSPEFTKAFDVIQQAQGVTATPEQTETVVAPETTPAPETPVATETPVVETPAAPEVKVETPEVKVETPVATEPTKHWFDIAPSEEAPTQNTNTTSSDAPVSATDDYKIHQQLMADPQYKMLVDIIKNGGDLTEVTKTFTVVDYNKMSDEKLIKEYGALANLTPEQIESEIESLNSKSLLEKKPILDNLRRELSQVQQGKYEQLTAAQQANAKRQQEIAEKALTDITRVKTEMIGKDFFGLKLTEDTANHFDKFAREFNSHMVRQDGTINAEFIRNCYFGTYLISKIQAAAKSDGKAEATEAVLKEVHRPSENTSAPSRIPTEPAPKSEQEKIKELEQDFRKHRFGATA